MHNKLTPIALLIFLAIISSCGKKTSPPSVIPTQLDSIATYQNELNGIWELQSSNTQGLHKTNSSTSTGLADSIVSYGSTFISYLDSTNKYPLEITDLGGDSIKVKNLNNFNTDIYHLRDTDYSKGRIIYTNIPNPNVWSFVDSTFINEDSVFAAGILNLNVWPYPKCNLLKFYPATHTLRIVNSMCENQEGPQFLPNMVFIFRSLGIYDYKKKP